MAKLITWNQKLFLFITFLLLLITILVWATDVSNTVRYFWTALFFSGVGVISTWRKE